MMLTDISSMVWYVSQQLGHLNRMTIIFWDSLSVIIQWKYERGFPDKMYILCNPEQYLISLEFILATQCDLLLICNAKAVLNLSAKGCI